MIGSGVQVYAVGTTGNGSAPAQLLSSALITTPDGSFTVSAGYTCPDANSVLYVVARGGSAGPGGANNNGAELMSVLGPCQNIAGNPGFTVNELTTVASAYTMAQFMSAGAVAGAAATNNTGISNAAATVANLVNLNTGVAPGPGFPAMGTAPTARLNALANLLNSCIVSPDTSCSPLYSATTVSNSAPSNTLDAVLNLAKNPALSTFAIYTATLASHAYPSALKAAPSDWTIFVTYKGGG